MMTHVNLCLIVFLILLFASMIMQFIRARKRSKLVQLAGPSALDPAGQEKWDSVDTGWDPFFKDFRKLQVLKKNLQRFPETVKSEYARYSLFSKLEMAVTISMLLFALLAYRFCA